MALYIQVPSEVAQDVTNVVMDAIGELEKAASDAKGEMDACHKCWDDFTAKIVAVMPEMKNAPLFSQAEEIVKRLQRLAELEEQIKDKDPDFEHE